eukprot:CAMPEP_0170380422 /NCGR_PEP_ID=MMETSP0117_2-20130122/13873_1 /TAXON_ID=400756 /ORGANISM="Durinskia baltica, Strain CSIRO CS-38" /LENGTH=430 /DNA_ID=CAMNT_0010635937 /DNA_START=81 /DNA_END=1373 /DNA_ORIENTATION=+
MKAPASKLQQAQQQNRKSGMSPWKGIALCMVIVILPWALYVNFHPRGDVPHEGDIAHPAHSLGQMIDSMKAPKVLDTVKLQAEQTAVVQVRPTNMLEFPDLPVLGPIPTNGAAPLFGVKHKGTDAIFALACNYPTIYYKRFVGSLRKFGYTEDIVLAVSPVEKMKPGVEAYVKQTGVVAYGFDVDCKGTDNCKLKDEFLGYPDPRPYRTFANIRYALYEYWMRHYSDNSYILILDFRDTFFQANPFQQFGAFQQRTAPRYDLQMYAENYDVKNIGICVFNSNWIKTCFGKPALEALRKEAVICSGSTLGSFPAVKHYVRTMLSSMDTVKCWLKGIESDQGYQNYLFYNGHFNTKMGNATLFHQGTGVVNTIGAMNGFRVPKEKKGPLDTFWKIRDKEGYVLNYDGTRSACVHQWDRWFDELQKFIDANLF